MAPDKDEHKWLHLMAGTIGVFVLLNSWYGTGSLEGLVQVSWGQVFPWISLALGLFVSAFLVEAYRRRRLGRDQWFIEVYAAIGGLFIADAVIGDFLTPLTSPFLESLIGGIGAWGVILLAIPLLVGLFFVLRRLWNAYGKMGEPVRES